MGYVRNEETLEASEYLNKLPKTLSKDDLILVSDPMLATGGTIVKVCFVSVHVASRYMLPLGISRLASHSLLAIHLATQTPRPGAGRHCRTRC